MVYGSVHFNDLEGKVMKLKKLWLYILTPLLVLFGSATLTNAVQAKELTKVITNVSIWEVDNSKFLQSDSKGVYNLSPQKHNTTTGAKHYCYN